MRYRFVVLLLIPVCLFAFISGVAKAPEVTAPETEATEETVMVTTVPTVETTAPTTEPTTPETTAPTTEPTTLETTAPTTEPTTLETTEAPMEPPVAEPHATEPEESALTSLGTFKLTAYCACQKCCGSYALNRPVDENGNVVVYGSIGVRLEAGISIAVDPRVIPYGTQVVIDGHTYTAHDTGGGIKGNRIDVYFDDHQEAWNFGTKYAEVFVYKSAD